MFDTIEDIRQEESTTGHETRAEANVHDNQAVRAAVAEGLTASAASSTGDPMNLWGGLMVNEKEKKKREPKEKKKLSPEEQEKKDFDTDVAKTLGRMWSILMTESNHWFNFQIFLQGPNKVINMCCHCFLIQDLGFGNKS